MPDDECGCYRCSIGRGEGVQLGPFILPSRMHVCADCGNKRCPRATYHDHACSGSNEPGQEGSRYA